MKKFFKINNTEKLQAVAFIFFSILIGMSEYYLVKTSSHPPVDEVILLKSNLPKQELASLVRANLKDPFSCFQTFIYPFRNSLDADFSSIKKDNGSILLSVNQTVQTLLGNYIVENIKIVNKTVPEDGGRGKVDLVIKLVKNSRDKKDEFNTHVELEIRTLDDSKLIFSCRGL